MKRKTNISVRNNINIRRNADMIVGDKYLGYVSGDILDANAVQEKINSIGGVTQEDLQEAISSLEDVYAPKADNGYVENPDTTGTSGQILSLNAQGETTWINPATAGDIIDDNWDKSEDKDQSTINAYLQDEIVQPIVSITTSTTSLSAELSKYYRFDVEVNNLAVTLPSVQDASKINNIVLYFTAGSTPNVTFVSSNSICYQFGFAIQSGKTYEINARWNGSSWIITNVEINIGGTTIIPYKISGGYNNTITNIDTEGYSASVQFKDNASAYNARIGASCVGGSNFASPYASDKKHIVEVELTDDDTSNIDLYLAALSEEITDNNRYNTFNLVAYATVNTGTNKRVTLEITDNYSAVYLYTTTSGWNTIKIKSIECKIVDNE